MAINTGLVVVTKEGAITKRAQYQAVYRLGSAVGDKFIVIKTLANGLEYSRFGFSVNKTVGKAVARNRVRRLLKEIVRSMPIESGWDVVFIARPKAVNTDYHQLRKSMDALLVRADLLVNKDEVVSTKVN